MNYKKLIAIIFANSLILALLAFIIDLDERVPNIWTNIYEILIITVLIAGFELLLVFSFISIRLLLKKKNI